MSNADALARAVRSRRLELGITTVKELAKIGRFTPKTASVIENGHKSTFRPATLSALDSALRWAPGSAQAVLDGGEPSPLPESDQRADVVLVDEAAAGSLADLLIGESVDELAEDEISEIESVARAAALKRKREILASRPASRPFEPAGEAEEEIPDFAQLAARTVTRRPGWDASQAGADAGEEPQD